MIQPNEFVFNAPYRDLIVTSLDRPVKSPEKTFPGRQVGSGNTQTANNRTVTIRVRK